MSSEKWRWLIRNMNERRDRNRESLCCSLLSVLLALFLSKVFDDGHVDLSTPWSSVGWFTASVANSIP
jgi:hypothetical protein